MKFWYVALYPRISCEINMSFLYERPGLPVEGVLLVAMVILLMGAGVLWFIGLAVAFGLLRKQSVTA